MPSSGHSAQTTTEWIFVARSLLGTANGQDQALRCMARAGMRAANANDWIATAAAWHEDFADLGMARECLEKAELLAEGTGEGWDDIVEAWAGMKDFRKVVELCREVHEPRPWPCLAEIESQGPLPQGTTVLDWIEPGETRQASRQAVENAVNAMENEDTLEAIRYLIDAESLAESTEDYLRIAERWRGWFPELEESERIMAEAEEAVDTPSDWVRIALKWKDDFQNYDHAVACMWQPKGGSSADWEDVLRAWRDDFQDLDNFRLALNKAYSEVESFESMTSMVLEDLDAYDLIEKASLVDLGTLTENPVSRVAAWDKGRHSEHRQGSLAGHYRFNTSRAGEAKIFLTSDVDNYLYLIRGEDPKGEAIAVDQGEGTEALSLITFNLVTGTYTIEVTTGQVGELGMFHLEIDLRGENIP